MALPDAALCDTSVVLRLFHEHDDEQQASAGALQRAWRDDRIELIVLDLTVYEFVNVITRRLGWGGARAARNVEHLFDLDLVLVACDRDLAVAAALTAAGTGLSGYDAAFVAAARLHDVALVTADERILAEAPDVAMALRFIDDT